MNRTEHGERIGDFVKLDRTLLAIAMARKGLNYKQLAEAAGVSTATLSYLNNGKTCKPEIAGRIARALGVDIENLIEEAR